jgi:tetratricopeptide (TPR) repeat protein
MNISAFRLRTFGAAAFVVVATVLAYLPALSQAFIWNDSDYVTAPALRSLQGLGQIWIKVGATQQYYPVLHSAFWLEHRFWGDTPFGYHLANVLLHACACVLFALVLRKLAVPGVWLAALLFALHPVHVESVAWVTEEKNTLSLIFYLGAALAYLFFDEDRRPWAYVAASALFLLSLGSKTVTSTLPATLLVVLWWKRGRLSWRRDALPLAPWLLAGACAGMFSSWVERHFERAVGADFSLTFVQRLLVAAQAVWSYAGKLVWPVRLNFVYPPWSVDPANPLRWLPLAGVIALTMALWALRRRARGPLAVWLLFVGSLFPVLGFVNLYGAIYSWTWDHWQYLADLAPLALAAAVLGRVRDGWARWAGSAFAGALLVVLGASTWRHCAMFHDEETLYRSTLELNPDSWLAQNNLANLLAGSPRRLEEAIVHYKATVRLRPLSADAHYNLATALKRSPGRLPEAIAEFRRAIDLDPKNADAHNNLGNALLGERGKQAEAIAQLEEAVHLKPGSARAHNNLGLALSTAAGRRDEAIAHYREAIRLEPGYSTAHLNLGLALAGIPTRLGESAAQLEQAVGLEPASAETHVLLAAVLVQIGGRNSEARKQVEAALKLEPGNRDAQRLQKVLGMSDF